LFEAAACGVPILSDSWEGLDTFFEPGRDILVGRTSEDAVAALDVSDAELKRIAASARERVLAEHTSGRRARDFEAAVETAQAGHALPAREAMEA
jgi:spore maturation protein CgeB